LIKEVPTPFYKKRPLPEHLVKAAKDANYPMTYRLQEGYDHSYYFIAGLWKSIYGTVDGLA
jgi:S-formylglutathione hydrolase FrmB